MSRVDDLPSNTIANIIKDLEAFVREVKGKQFIGLDSILYSQNDSGASYDWTGTLPQSPSEAAGIGSRGFMIESTADNDRYLFGDLVHEVYINSISPSNKLSFDPSVFNSLNGVFFWDAPLLSDNGVTKRWIFILRGNTTSTYFAKFYTITSSPADITVTLL